MPVPVAQNTRPLNVFPGSMCHAGVVRAVDVAHGRPNTFSMTRNTGYRPAYAAIARRASAHCDQISDSAVTSRSMSPSEWTGDGVSRSRSVPTGTVG